MKSQIVKWTLDKIIFGRNVRLPQNMNIPELGMDIGANGMNKRPTVFAVKGGNVEIISGHRRVLSARWLKENDPVAFKKWFGKGEIEVEVISDVSYEEAQLLKIDHGNEQPLRGLELQLCANMLFDYGMGEKQVVIRLAQLLDTIMPMKANKKKKLEELRTQLEQLVAVNAKKDLIKAKEKEIEDFVFEYRRGACQNLHDVYRCPSVVMAALYLKETGEYPEDVDESLALPARITMNDVKKLYKAFKKDLEVTDDKGARKFNKELPGPDFEAAWKEVLADSEEKENAEPGSRSKAKSHKELVAEAKDKWDSTGFQLLTKYHANEAIEMKHLKAEDKLLFVAEIVSERAPEEWAEMVKLCKGLTKEVAAENREVEAAKAASK